MKTWYATTWFAVVLWFLFGTAFNYPQFFDRTELANMPAQLPKGMGLTLVNGSGFPATYLSYEADIPAAAIRLRSFSPVRLIMNLGLLAAVISALVYCVPQSFSLRTTFLFVTAVACCIAVATASTRQPAPQPASPVSTPQNGIAAAPPPPTPSIDFVPALMLGIYFAPVPIAMLLRLRKMVSSKQHQRSTADPTASNSTGMETAT